MNVEFIPLSRRDLAEILEPAPQRLRPLQDLAYLTFINKLAPRFSSLHRESWDQSKISLILLIQTRSHRDSQGHTEKVETIPRSRKISLRFSKLHQEGWDHSKISENLAEILQVAPRWLRPSGPRSISVTKIAPRFALSSQKNFHRGYDIMKKWMVGWYIFTIQVVWSQGQNVSLAEKLLEFLVHKKNTCSINITSTISFRV